MGDRGGVGGAAVVLLFQFVCIFDALVLACNGTVTVASRSRLGKVFTLGLGWRVFALMSHCNVWVGSSSYLFTQKQHLDGQRLFSECFIAASPPEEQIYLVINSSLVFRLST